MDGDANTVQLRWHRVVSSFLNSNEYDDEQSLASFSSSLCGNRIYVFGGLKQRIYRLHPIDQDIFYVLDYSKREWRQMFMRGDWPSSRHGHTATVVDDVIIFIGGRHNSITQNDLHKFDVVTSRWSKETTHGEKPLGYFLHSADWDPDKKRIITFGGLKYTDNLHCSDLYALKVGELKWHPIKTKGKFPRPRLAHCSCIANSKLHIFGGITGRGLVNDHCILILNNRIPVWTTVRAEESHPVGRYGATMTFAGGYVFHFGGGTFAGASNQLNLFDDRHMSWTRLDKFATEAMGDSEVEVKGTAPSSRAYHCAIYAGDRIIILGGEGMNDDGFKSYYELHFRGVELKSLS